MDFLRSKALRTLFLVVTVTLSLAITGASEDDMSIPKWIEPTHEVVSPHIRWKNPSAREPIKVLFITYRMGMREIIEIAQRFEMEYNVFALEGRNRFFDSGYQFGAFRGINIKHQNDRLREKLTGEYDCIVLGNIKWDILPEWARKEILQKVKDGTGLVGYLWETFTTRKYRDKTLDMVLENKVTVDLNSVIGAFPYSGLPAFRKYSDFKNWT